MNIKIKINDERKKCTKFMISNYLHSFLCTIFYLFDHSSILFVYLFIYLFICVFICVSIIMHFFCILVPSNPDLVTLKQKPFYATLVTTSILCLFLSNFIIYHNFHFFTFCSIDTLDTILVIIIISLILTVINVIITSIIFSSICLNQ